jgi:hypothetical protein
MNLRETAEVLAYFSAAYPKYELFEETVAVWADQFDQTDFAVAKAAAKKLVATDQFFPSVARFREVLGVELRGLPAESCDLCDNGFVLVEGGARLCRVCRPHQPPVPAPPALQPGLKDWRSGLLQARKGLQV